ncbi:PREDICTED: CDP-diacylglycerol--glycerol-3-phosphate 3-phosphatidyltransferase, mitochondrial, partial [Chlamydotis macqueenii]|uniref:CDP-diacylglycerol--glycerol-3-phosphate 3-phosphatidyltransferase, mitochondrial n=1 Tax=Chlamydotis macqueenii TaxID=187382 RepID=UPI00052A11B4
SSWLLLAPLLTPPVPVITAPPCSLCPEGAHRFQWIRNLVPEFGISSSHVKVLSSPAEFYELLKVQIKTAKQRVVMASLYLGTGFLEQELVDCLEETLEKSLQAKGSSNLRVSILLDYTRGSRGRKNSRTMLIPLLQRFPEQVRVSLFHTPNLRGLLRLLIPERFNETIGLQHIKVYLFDDNVILSGANLSDLYFTNRQDRYVLLQDSPEIADFFTELVDAIGDVSLQLQRDDTVQMMEGMVHPYQGDKMAYCEIANRRVMEVINSARTRQELLHTKAFHSSQQGSSLLSQQGSRVSGGLKPEPDTWIYPLIQMKPFGIQIDEMVTETLLTEAERDARIYLTTGYFNLTQAYMDLILGTRAEYRILLASPEVNGFFGAKGVAGAIPAAYVYIEQQFYSEVCCLHQQERVRLQEYSRAGWTFHAKGKASEDLFRRRLRLVRIWVAQLVRGWLGAESRLHLQSTHPTLRRLACINLEGLDRSGDSHAKPSLACLCCSPRDCTGIVPVVTVGHYLAVKLAGKEQEASGCVSDCSGSCDSVSCQFRRQEAVTVPGTPGGICGGAGRELAPGGCPVVLDTACSWQLVFVGMIQVQRNPYQLLFAAHGKGQRSE